MSFSTSKAARQAQNRKTVSGTTKYIKKSVTLNGEEVSPKDIVTFFGQVQEASDKVDQLRLQLDAAVKADQAAQARAKTMTTSIRALVISQYGDASPCSRSSASRLARPQ